MAGGQGGAGGAGGRAGTYLPPPQPTCFANLEVGVGKREGGGGKVDGGGGGSREGWM